jgi:hypothetical protein
VKNKKFYVKIKKAEKIKTDFGRKNARISHTRFSSFGTRQSLNRKKKIFPELSAFLFCSDKFISAASSQS